MQSNEQNCETPLRQPSVRVLFQCKESSLRALLAAPLLNHLGKGEFSAHLAKDLESDFRVMQVLGEINIKPSIPSTGPNKEFDYIINLCDQSSASCSGPMQDCPVSVGCAFHTCWGFSNPLAGRHDEEVMKLMRHVRDDIANRLCTWMPAALHAHKERIKAGQFSPSLHVDHLL